jgi:hypothetical protein
MRGRSQNTSISVGLTKDKRTNSQLRLVSTLILVGLVAFSTNFVALFGPVAVTTVAKASGLTTNIGPRNKPSSNHNQLTTTQQQALAPALAQLTPTASKSLQPHGITYTPQSSLTEPSAAITDSFGIVVALSDDGLTALVGAYLTNNGQGATYIYTRPNTGVAFGSSPATTWVDPTPAVANDQFGSALFLSPDGLTAVVGAYGKSAYQGATYIYSRASTGVAFGSSPTTTLNNPTAAPSPDCFGYNVALSGDSLTLVVNAISANNSEGVAYVYTRASMAVAFSSTPATTWADPAPAESSDKFGEWLTLSEDGLTAVVTAEWKNNQQGVAYVYSRASAGVAFGSDPTTTLTDPAPTVGQDDFGNSVALSRDGLTLVIGDYGKYWGQGVVYIYIRPTTSAAFGPNPVTTLSDPAPVYTSDQFGYQVSLSGNGLALAVGTFGKSGYLGATYIYTRASNSATFGATATSSLLDPSSAVEGDLFGVSVALSYDGLSLLVGASGKNNNTGAAYIYTGTPNTGTASLTALSGNNQSTPISTNFNSNLAVLASDSAGNPMSNVQVTFTAPTTGATGTFVAGNLSSVVISTDINGIATTSAFAANATTGSYSVVASAPSYSNTVSFNLINTKYVYYLPYLANTYLATGGNFTTYLAFQNTGTATANFSLTYYDPNGNVLSGPALTGSCATLTIHAECLPPNPLAAGRTGTGVIVSDQPLGVIVAEGTPFGGSAYAVSNGSASQLIVPVAFYDAYGDFSTQLTVFNGSSTAVTATVQFYSNDGVLQKGASQNLTLGALTGQTLDQALATSKLSLGFTGWAQITGPSGSQLVGQVLEQSPSQHFVAIAAAQSQTHTSLYAPAIFKGAFGFNTGASIINPNSQAVALSITYYDGSGNPITTAPFNLDPNAVVAIYQGGSGNHLGLPSGNGLVSGFSGAAIITATNGGVVMIENESGGVTSIGTSLSGTYVAAGSGSSSVGLPVMAKGGYGYNTGATIFNTSNSVASGTIQYYDVNGNTVGPSQPFSIGPYASQLAYQGGASFLPSGFYGSAVVTQSNSVGSGLIVTTNAQSGLFYTYTEPNF